MTDPTAEAPEPEAQPSGFRLLLPWVLVVLVAAALGVGLAVALMDSDHHDAARFDAEHHGANMPMGGSSTMPHAGSQDWPMEDESMGRGADGAGTSAEADGLAASQDGYTLRLVRSTAKVGANRLALRIERDGEPLTGGFEVQHTRRLHVIVARRDLSGYAHLHPRMRADGTWVDTLELDRPGPYRVFADFQTDGDKHVLGADLTVPGDYRPDALPPATTSATVDGYRVTVNRDVGSGDVRFRVFKAGRPVTDLAQLLGARGHLVALRVSDLAYLHTHPDESVKGNRIDFEAEFASEGAYRLFLQFRVGGSVHTAHFTVDATT